MAKKGKKAKGKMYKNATVGDVNREMGNLTLALYGKIDDPVSKLEDSTETMARAIDADCEITGDLIDDKGRTCAMGKLALEAGYEEEDLRDGTFSEVAEEGNDGLMHTAFPLFAFDSYELESKIIRNNDGTKKNVETRRKQVLGAVRTHISKVAADLKNMPLEELIERLSLHIDDLRWR